MLYGALGAWLTAALSFAVFGGRQAASARDAAPGVAGGR
jgi:hypothetical protein